MSRPLHADEELRAWNAILADTPVFSSDGQEVGGVAEVLGSEDQSIFHGIVIASRSMANDAMIPADQVVQITNRRVSIGLTGEEVRQLPPYVPEESFQLGLVGLLGRKVGWQLQEREDPK